MAVDGVSGLGVGALKVEQVARFEAYAGAGEAYPCGCQGAETLGQHGLEVCVLAHAVSSLSG